MKVYLLVATLATFAQARPDIGLNYLPAAGGNFGTSSFQKNTYQGQGGFSTGTGGIGGGGFKAVGGGNFGGGYGGATGSGSSSSFHTAGSIGGSTGSAGFGGHAGQQEITNTVYFYDAPQDEIIPAASIRIDGGAGSQHNRVVFIKAPGYQTQQITDISGNVGGSGEKTKIYVLAKRPEGQQDVIINTASHSSVAKPEVYYIKYNTQQDAEEQILGSLNGQGGNAAQSVESDHAFVQTIHDSVDVRSQGPIVHNIGGQGGSVVEPGAQILGLSGASFTNGQRTGGGSGTVSQISTGSSSFQTTGGFVSKTGGGYQGQGQGQGISVGGNEPYNYPRPN